MLDQNREVDGDDDEPSDPWVRVKTFEAFTLPVFGVFMFVFVTNYNKWSVHSSLAEEYRCRISLRRNIFVTNYNKWAVHCLAATKAHKRKLKELLKSHDFQTT